MLVTNKSDLSCFGVCYTATSRFQQTARYLFNTASAFVRLINAELSMNETPLHCCSDCFVIRFIFIHSEDTLVTFIVKLRMPFMRSIPVHFPHTNAN